MKNPWILGAVALAAGWSYAVAAPDAASPSVLVTQTALRQGSLPRTIEAYGVVQASAAGSRTMMAATSATVQALYVRDGEEVNAGAPLMQLVPSPQTTAAYIQAQSALRVAEQLATRTKQMFAQHLATAQQWEDAQKAESDAQSNLAALKAEGAGGVEVLRAPFRAIVLHVSASQGAQVSAGTPLADLVRPEKAILKAGAVPAQAMLVGGGDTVRVRAVGGDQNWPATVVQRGAMVDPATGLVPIEIALPPGRFLPGEAADATITVGQTQGYVVPHAAILVDDHGGTYVVQDDGSKARKVAVSIAGSHQDQDVIRGTGLNPGQPLVLSGNYQLDDGMSMRVQQQDNKGEQ